MTRPRGIRNNNPGNIEAGIEWQGLAIPSEMSAEQKWERRFAVFKNPEWGIRAMAKVLGAYRTKHNLNTIAGIIGRWAPAGDGNDVGAYSRNVAQAVGVSPDAVIDTTDLDVMAKLITGMIQHENGEQPYKPEQIRLGISLASGPVQVVPAPGGGNIVVKNKAKVNSAIRSLVIAIGGFVVGMGYADQEQWNTIMDFVDRMTTPEMIAAFSAALAALWGIFDPNKKIGKGDLK